MASNNDRRIYYDLNSGQKYVLFEESITSGGEGSIYNIEGMPDLVAKIYHEKNRTENRKNKLLAMLETDSNDLSECAWPHAILYQDNNFCGYVMQKVSGLSSLIDFYVYDNRKKYLWSQYVKVAENIAAAVNNVHDSGHIIGDLNPNNFMLDVNTGRVMLVDTDSYHIKSKSGEIFPCTVVTPEFIPPELQGKTFDENNARNMFNESTDNFALAVIIFRLLMNGVHPFSCVVTTKESMSNFQPVKNIQNGYCPYFTKSNINGKIAKTRYSPNIGILPRDIQKLFERAFIEGQQSKSARPRADEWFYALDSLSQRLCKCTDNPKHEYFIGLSSCPWCKLDMEIRNKSKPNPGDLKIDDGWEEFRRKQNKEKASKDEINRKNDYTFIFPPTCPICGALLVNGKCLSCNSTPKTNPQSKPHSTPKTNPQPKTHNEDKEATRALIATILIISFFLILALIGIYSDESSPNYAENVTDTYNYYDDTIDSSLYKTNSIFTPMSTIDKNELSENKQEISIENIETNVDEISAYAEIDFDEEVIWDVPETIFSYESSTIPAPTLSFSVNIYDIDISFDSDATVYDLIAETDCDKAYVDPFSKNGIDFYDKENGHATVSLFYAAPCSGNLFIKKSNGEVLKKIPIDIAWKDCEFVSSNEDIITFGDEQFEIKSTGKLTISYIYGDDVVAEKEVEVI